MSPYIPKPSLTPLHLYRHLLREISYLPPVIRPSFDYFVRLRFLQHRPYKAHRTPGHLKQAQRTLRNLRAANNGDYDILVTLLEKGLGRQGIRRHELMSKFTPAAAPTDSQALETLIAKAQEVPSPDSKAARTVCYEKWDLEKILDILRSQKKQQEVSGNSLSWLHKIKALNPETDVPKTNIWGKPPAESLQKTKRANWWKRAATKVMPPLAKGEWEQLGRLSRGEAGAEWAPPARRARARLLTQPDTEASPPAWNWEGHASRPTGCVEASKSKTWQRRTGDVDRGPYSVGDITKTIKPRVYQRVYQRLWVMTPWESRDPKTLKHSFTWGSQTGEAPSARKMQLAFFEGVDSQGKKITAPK